MWGPCLLVICSDADFHVVCATLLIFLLFSSQIFSQAPLYILSAASYAGEEDLVTAFTFKNSSSKIA